MRATAPYKCAPTDERLGMNGGDPVCRLFRLSLSGFRSLAGPALPTSGSRTPNKACSGHSRRRGTIISGRFRGGKLVGSGRYSKCFFAGAPSAFCRGSKRFLPGLQALFAGLQVLFAGAPSFFCRGPTFGAHARVLATRARGVPLRSGRGGDGASPTAANKCATGSAWPMPSSTTKTPPGASKVGAAVAMAR